MRKQADPSPAPDGVRGATNEGGAGRPAELVFELAPEVGKDALLAELPPSLSWRAADEGRERWVVLDTFDRRLTRAGYVLRTWEAGGATHVAWSNGVGRRQDVAGAPLDFAQSLPAGPIRASLAPILGPRRLLPLVEVETRGPRIDVLDRRGKTVVRLRLEAVRFRDPRVRGTWGSLSPSLRVTPLRGYSEECAALLRALSGRSPLQALEAQVDARAARALLGGEPAEDPTRLAVELHAGITAHEGLWRIHRALLAQMQAQEAGVRADLDPEFLHDFRVAGRRMRSVLSQVKRVFPAERIERFRAELSWLGSVTGPTRDVDVLLESLDRDAREAEGAGIAALRDLIRAEQRGEHARLVEALDSPRYRALVAELEGFLGSPPAADDPELVDAGRPLRDVLRERLRRLLRRILKRGAAVAEDTAASDIHRLRLDCKKLRYLLDCGRGLFAEPLVASVLKALRRLQDVLGRSNDLEVQGEWLAGFAARLQQQGRLEVPIALALGRLVEQRARRARKARRKLAKRFARFASRRGRARFAALLAAEPSA